MKAKKKRWASEAATVYYDTAKERETEMKSGKTGAAFVCIPHVGFIDSTLLSSFFDDRMVSISFDSTEIVKKKKTSS